MRRYPLISRRKSYCSQAGNLKMSEILADPRRFSKNVSRGRHFGGFRVETEVFMNSSHQAENALKKGLPGRKRHARVPIQFRVRFGAAGVEDKLVRIQTCVAVVACEIIPHQFPVHGLGEIGRIFYSHLGFAGCLYD